MAARLVVLRGVGEPLGAIDGDSDTIAFPLLRAEVLGRSVFRWLGRYRRADMLVPERSLMTNPLKSGVLLRLIGRRGGAILDTAGQRTEVTWRWIVRQAARATKDLWRSRALFRDVDREMAALAGGPALSTFDVSDPPVYLRTDLWPGVTAGGSVAHTAGVVNGLRASGLAPVVLTTIPTPTIRSDIEVHRLQAPDAYWDVREAPYFAANRTIPAQVLCALDGRRPGFVYQRYALGSYVGLCIARSLGVPFVCEFNGSEVWIARHWGEEALHREERFSAVERLNVSAADLVVVVSESMAEQARGLGASDERILVAPNGVDPETYHPDVDSSSVRQCYGFGAKTLIGFIGTFGAWHGAEVLADAFGRLVSKRPELRDHIGLLMIGDGARMPQVREFVARHGIEDLVVLTGTVAQEDGPKHLGACDILVSPHVPNPDGTPFFGSPTKLFEYMAMGKGIVASDLGQIGDVLDHDETAWLVEPGDPEGLMHGLEVLVDDPERRRRLGTTARAKALAEHTWFEHTRRIVEALRRCSASP